MRDKCVVDIHGRCMVKIRDRNACLVKIQPRPPHIPLIYFFFRTPLFHSSSSTSPTPHSTSSTFVLEHLFFTSPHPPHPPHTPPHPPLFQNTSFSFLLIHLTHRTLNLIHLFFTPPPPHHQPHTPPRPPLFQGEKSSQDLERAHSSVWQSEGKQRDETLQRKNSQFKSILWKCQHVATTATDCCHLFHWLLPPLAPNDGTTATECWHHWHWLLPPLPLTVATATTVCCHHWPWMKSHHWY